jgi:hypothetical protein
MSNSLVFGVSLYEFDRYLVLMAKLLRGPTVVVLYNTVENRIINTVYSY